MLYECKHYITDRTTIDQNINWHCVLEVKRSPDRCDIGQAIILLTATATATATATSDAATNLAETMFLCGLLRQDSELDATEANLCGHGYKLLTVCLNQITFSLRP